MKEASIADAEERAFKRLLDEEQSGHEMPEFSDEMHVKFDPSFLTDLRPHEIPNIKAGDSSIYKERADAPSHKQHLAKPEYENDYKPLRSETAIHLGPPVDTRPLTLDAKHSTQTAEPITNTLKTS